MNTVLFFNQPTPLRLKGMHPLRCVLSPLCLGTIPPLLKTGDPISDNMSGSGGLKMVVTITSILVVAVLAFIMLMVLKRRRREQRLKRLRGLSVFTLLLWTREVFRRAVISCVMFIWH